MAISPGTRFGSYEIGDPIGAGGMGEVYRATDTTLERDVAIKVLPASFAEDAERVTRFEREAKTLASLNHPNIAQIYGLERSDSTTALVMELVQGLTLEDRIAEGPLPADEALGIAMQIADALEAAHSQNIIHRDLKPANIKLKDDGTVKVLDFGIAKALAPENLTSGPQSPIMTTPATQVGVILGTAAYMSPEQAKGKAVDQRTDIWAFGCVLYEMLTGQLAFGAEDVPTTLARIIANDTNLDTLPAAVSPAVRKTIDLCLQKDPRKRVRDIGDVRLALEGAFATASSIAVDNMGADRSFLVRPLPIAATAVLLTGLVALAIGWRLWPSSDSLPVTRFAYALPDGQSFRRIGWSMLSISRDGRQFVYNTQDGLYIRRLDTLAPLPIPGTEEQLDSVIMSPDGQSVVFWSAPDALRRISINGGMPSPIAPVGPGLFGLSWEAGGTILYSTPDGIMRVSANGGAPGLVIPVDQGRRFWGPRLLPDGESVLFNSAVPPGWQGQIVVHSLTTAQRTVLVESGTDARYLPSGHLVYAVNEVLFARALDLDTLTVYGGETPVVQGVARAGGTGFSGIAHYDVSDNGTLIYATGNTPDVPRALVWVDRQGREEQLDAPLRAYTYPRISPDGTMVALDVRDQEFDIWIRDLERETMTRLTFDPGEDEFPAWSPDSQRIAFSSSRDGGTAGDTAVYWRAADGTGSAVQLVSREGQVFPSSFLPDGAAVLVRTNAYGDDNISLVSIDDDADIAPLLATSFNERNPEISPDGRWLAYVSDESGSEEIYVRPFPDVDSGRWQVSADGGGRPVWSRDGSELFYLNGQSMMAVSIQTEPTFLAGTPELLFEGEYFTGFDGRTYDYSDDRDRFLMIKEVDDDASRPQIIIVENWFEELERLVPTN